MLAMIAHTFPAYTIEAIDRLADITLLWRSVNLWGYYQKMLNAKESKFRHVDADLAELLQEDYLAERAKW